MTFGSVAFIFIVGRIGRNNPTSLAIRRTCYYISVCSEAVMILAAAYGSSNGYASSVHEKLVCLHLDFACGSDLRRNPRRSAIAK